jgi:hypothetical protein
MDRTATKEAAEALLRELPSVIGAHVLEDVFGHPREIHVLISAGPAVRHFARDVRDLLEERLGVPVDQRVISVAQLAGEAPDPASAAPPWAGARAAAEPGLGGSTDPAPAGDPTAGDRTGAAESADASHAADAVPTEPPRLLLDGTSIERRDGRLAVHVRLRHGGVVFEGTDTQIDTPQALLRAGARALLDAATHAARGHGHFSLEEAAVVRAIGRDYVLLTVLARSPRFGRRPLALAGAHAVDEEIEVTAALASLKAINRVFARLHGSASF